jgi:DNA-binding beta-propeller fold protein YncE
VAGKYDVEADIDAIGEDARFSIPRDVSISFDMSFALVANKGGQTIKRIDLATRAVTTVAGWQISRKRDVQGTTDGIGTAARFSDPSGVVVSSDMSFALVANIGTGIRRIDLETYQVTTINSQQQGLAIAMPLDMNFALLLTGHEIWRLDLTNQATATLANPCTLQHVSGNGSGYLDATGTNSKFARSFGIAVAPDGSFGLLYESYGFRVRHLKKLLTELALTPNSMKVQVLLSQQTQALRCYLSITQGAFAASIWQRVR